MDPAFLDTYSHVSLWTIDICKAARHLYEELGFQLTDTKINTTWANYPMMEELGEYDADQNIELVSGEEAISEMKELIVEYTDDIMEKGGEEVRACLKWKNSWMCEYYYE